jgi:cation-transporting ATPase E
MDSNFASMKYIVREGRMIISNIERVSALYLTKTIYSVLLSIIFIILGRTYPFVPIHLSIISSTAIGIPSFILTLEQTETVTSNGFMRNVLRISLPSALTMVLMMLINQVVAGFFGFDAKMLSTYNLLLAASISQMVVWEVCRPMNTRRRILCVAIAVIFVAAILLLPGFFSITAIFNWRLIFIIPLMILTRYIMQWLTKAVRILTKQH